jgi:hypothetical protein
MDTFPYKTWALFFGEQCSICGKKPTPEAPLVRDHEHRVIPGVEGGGMRGLLCFRCNKNLPYWATLEWAESTLAYLRRYHGLSDR